MIEGKKNRDARSREVGGKERERRDKCVCEREKGGGRRER